MDKMDRLTPEHRDNLVAYLDGELDAVATQTIERVIARNDVAHHEAESLSRTWQLLDHLPRPKASQQFTERTISSLRVAEVRAPVLTNVWSRRLRGGLIAFVVLGGLMVAGLIGFLATNRWIPNDSQKLLDDLPVVENLEAYSDVEEIRFLRELRSSKAIPSARKER